MSRWNSQIRALMLRFDSRPLRDRALMLALAVGAVVYASFSLGLGPVSEASARLERQISGVEVRLQAQENRAAEIRQLRGEDMDRAAAEVLRRLSARQGEVDAEIEGLAGDLVSPNDMTQLLTTVLEQQEGLSLTRIENRQPQALRSSEVAAGQDGTPALQVYRHGLSIEFEGDYFATLRYLLYLESLGSSFFWDEIRFQQSEGPRARVMLEIHTLSSDEGFIGV